MCSSSQTCSIIASNFFASDNEGQATATAEAGPDQSKYQKERGGGAGRAGGLRLSRTGLRVWVWLGTLMGTPTVGGVGSECPESFRGGGMS